MTDFLDNISFFAVAKLFASYEHIANNPLEIHVPDECSYFAVVIRMKRVGLLQVYSSMEAGQKIAFQVLLTQAFLLCLCCCCLSVLVPQSIVVRDLFPLMDMELFFLPMQPSSCAAQEDFLLPS